ncbi:Methylated adenine and cytosine restriction protein [Moritella viscosa]|nr:Methylated adenine and cytosine restriction protein [Moritella viscosa]
MASEGKLRDVINALANKFEISEEEKVQTLPSGKQSILDNRVGWARTYLTKAALLEVTKRSHFIIIDRGVQALSDKMHYHHIRVYAFSNSSYERPWHAYCAYQWQRTDKADAALQH